MSANKPGRNDHRSSIKRSHDTNHEKPLLAPEPNAVTSSESTNTSSEQGFSGCYLAEDYASDGEESRFSTSSYQIGRRRKLNYVATDILVDRDNYQHELNLLAGSIMEEEEEEQEEDDEQHHENNTVVTDYVSQEAFHAALHDDSLDVSPPNTLRYEMDVEVQRLVQRNKRVLVSKLLECGSRRNLTMVRHFCFPTNSSSHASLSKRLIYQEEASPQKKLYC